MNEKKKIFTILVLVFGQLIGALYFIIVDVSIAYKICTLLAIEAFILATIVLSLIVKKYVKEIRGGIKK